MRIGKQENPVSAICDSDAERIIVRGEDLCADLIGKIDFTSYFWFLVTGQRPDENQLYLANAMLVALAEHGLVPSVVAARMTLAAAPEAFHGAVAAGLLGCGSVVLGSAEVTGHFLAHIAAQVNEGVEINEAARTAIIEQRTERKAIPGFGHPQHSAGDPRANLLLDLARDRGADRLHVQVLEAIKVQLPEAIGRELPININGAIPAILLDIGFPLSSLKAISILARTAGLIGHLTEEAVTPIGFIMSGAAAAAIKYEGKEGLSHSSE